MRYLIEKADILGSHFNLRTQNKAFSIYQASIKQGRNWKADLDLFFENQLSEPRKLLYMFAGNEPVKRMDFVRFLMREKGWSYATVQRKINDWIILGEIKTNGLKKQAILYIGD